MIFSNSEILYFLYINPNKIISDNYYLSILY